LVRTLKYDLFSGTIKDDLAELPTQMLQGAFEAIDQGADLIVGLAQIHVRVDKGNLRDSIRKEYVVKDELKGKVRVVAGSPTVRYARIIEEKWPYLAPAVDNVLPQIRTMIENKVVDKVG